MGQHALAHLKRQIADGHQVLVRLGREADHVIQLQVLDAARKNELRAIENLVVGHRLVDNPSKPIGTRFRSNRDPPLTAGLEQLHNRLGQVVEAKRRGADEISHLPEPLENVFDVRVVAQRDRDEADAAGHRPGCLGQLQDSIGRKRADRQVVVTGPAEAAQVRAAPHDLNEEA